MNRLIAITGMAVLIACLIGWAALAWAQPNMGKLTPANDLSADATGTEPVGGQSSFVDSPPKSGSLAPATAVPSVTPAPAAPRTGMPLLLGMSPVAPARQAPSVMPIGPISMQGPGVTRPTDQAPIGPMEPARVSSKPAPNDPGLANDGLAKGAEGITGSPALPSQPLKPVGLGTTLSPLGGAGEPNGTHEGSASDSPLSNDEPSSDSTVTPDNTTARQEPAISLEWVGSPTAKVGQSGTYSLVVRNACSIPVQQVLLRVRVPDGLTCSDTEPKAIAEKNVLVWELGTLQAKQEKILQMKLLAEHKGDVSPQAWVTFTGSSVMRIKVREPKLVLKAQGPQKVLVGETATFILAVSNPGDGAAEQVKIHAVLSEGLENARGPKMDFDLGNLTAGETRNVSMQCISKSGGLQKCEATAEAEGGLHAKDSLSVSVTMPRLDLQVSGPGLRYVGRKAVFTLKVINPGDAPASNVTISDLVPEGFKVLAASESGQYDFTTRTVSWFVSEVGPGQAHEVKLEVQAINPGEFKHKASAIGARGLRSESELTTRIEGLSALMLELVDTEDPIEVNSETAYEVRITNTGFKVETDIKLVASIPDKMEFKNATGPVRYHEEGKTIVFEPIEKLAPKADGIFRINVKALDAGTVRFKIQMTSTNLTEPVIKMEATRIYSDAPDVKSSH